MVAYGREGNVWAPFFHGFSDAEMFAKKNALEMPNCYQGLLGNFFQQAQLLAMSRYFELGYLTADEVRYYLEHSLDFSDRPISFFHRTTSERPPKALFDDGENDYHMVFEGRNVNGHQGREPDPGYLESSLYSVAGQRMKLSITSELTPGFEHLDLPWAVRPEFKEAAKAHFSRKLYPLVWELGRAVSLKEGNFKEMMSFAAEDILKQVMHHGPPSADLLSTGRKAPDFRKNHYKLDLYHRIAHW